MPNLPRFLANFDQNYKIFAKKLRFRIRRVVLERVMNAILQPLSLQFFWLPIIWCNWVIFLGVSKSILTPGIYGGLLKRDFSFDS